MAGLRVVVWAHFVDSAGVNPPVVEIEKAAHQDRVVNRLVRAALPVERVDVFLAYRCTVVVYFLDIRQQRLLRRGDRSSLIIFENGVDQAAIPQEFPRNCGVAAESKKAAIQLRCESRNQLPEPCT